MRGFHIFWIPVITTLFCFTTLKGCVIHYNCGHFCFKELIFNFHWNHGTKILSTIVLYFISILISKSWSPVFSIVCLTSSIPFTSSSSSVTSCTSSLFTSSALTTTITYDSSSTSFVLNNRCCCI